jgi:DNA processing protein
MQQTNSKNKIILALSKVVGVGNVKILEIIEQTSEFQSNETKELIEKMLGVDKFSEYQINLNNLQKDEVLFERLGIDYFTILDKFYPEQLKLVESPPVILFFKGKYKFEELESFFSKMRFGIVGSRNIIQKTKLNINSVIAELKNTQIVTVSGMAFGADSELHLNSISNEIPTIAVLASDVNNPTPEGNSGLYFEICKKGLVLSEYYPGNPVHAGNFVQRNRIVAGLSDVLLVAQAKVKSGSMITPNIAFQIGAKVFALPGDFNEEEFEGCNQLISDGTAKLFRGKQDILDLFGVTSSEIDKYSFLLPEQIEIVKFIKQSSMSSIEDLNSKFGYERQVMLNLLIDMQIKGVVSTNLSGLYVVNY